MSISTPWKIIKINKLKKQTRLWCRFKNDIKGKPTVKVNNYAIKNVDLKPTSVAINDAFDVIFKLTSKQKWH